VKNINKSLKINMKKGETLINWHIKKLWIFIMYIEPADRYQYQLMSSLDDLIAPDHPVRIIDKIVDAIVSANKERFEKERSTEVGRPAYHDATHIKLYLYGYFNGIKSSRKLEVETHRNKELIWLLGGLTPDHWTISNYRKEKADDIKYVTKKFREFLRDNGYIKLKTVAIDGSKIKANTNRDMLTIDRIEKKTEGIEGKIEEYLSKIAENDDREDIIEEIEAEDKEENRKKYLDKIIELKKQLEDLQKQKEILENEGRNYISRTDQQARLMKSRDGKIPGYNVQIAVDGEYKMIADSEVVTDESDFNQLPNMIESIKEELDKVPEEVIADKGYHKPDLIEQIEKKDPGIKIYSPPEKTIKDKEEIKFTYDKEKDEYECSLGKKLVLKQKNKKFNKTLKNVYQGLDCDGCPQRNKCTNSKKGRIIHRYSNQQWRDEYKMRMQSAIGKEKVLLRKTMAEHPFGTIKCLMGKIPLLLRGLRKVSTEINIYTTVYNLKRLINIESFDLIILKISEFKWKTT
jgi:transposase